MDSRPVSTRKRGAWHWSDLALLGVSLLAAYALQACAVLAGSEVVYATDTPLPPTPTTTPTIVWFPPTATTAPFPTPLITPTVAVQTPTGNILFRDRFDDPTAWSLGASDTSSAALSDQALTLALNQPGGYIFSLRKEPILSDFYLEITASPSICQGSDEYGVLFRVSPALEFYRFSLSCDGYLRLDRFINGHASSPYPRTISGAVPPGAPSLSRIAISVEGKEMIFFVNDLYQFTVSDPTLTSGTLGVFARSGGENAVTVSFSDLVVRQVLH